MKILFLYQVHKHPEIKKTLIQYSQNVHKHPEIKNLIQNLQKKGSQTSRDKKPYTEFAKERFTNIKR